MFSLTINNILIPVPTNISFPLVLNSPLFITDGTMEGSYVFNVKLPATDQIRTAVGQAHRSQLSSRATDEYDYVLVMGSLCYKGKCVVTEANHNYYEISLNIENGDFYAAIKNKSLKDLDLGGDREYGSGIYSNVANSVDFVVSESQQVVMEDEDPYNFDIVNIDTSDSVNLIDHSITFTESGTAKFRACINSIFVYGIVAFNVYRNGVLEEAFEICDGINNYESDYSIIANDVLTFTIKYQSVEIGNPSQSQEMIDFTILAGSWIELILNDSGNLDNFSLAAAGDQDTFDYAIFPIENKSFFDNFPDDAFMLDNTSLKVLNSEYFFIQNYWKDGRFPLMMSGIKDGRTYVSANVFTPFPYIKYLVGCIAAEAGYTLVNTPFDYIREGQHPVGTFRNAVLFNAFAENNFTSAVPYLTPFKTTFNLVDHVPDMDQGSFFKQVCLLTGYMPVVDNQLRTITFIHLPEAHDDPEAFPGTVIVNPTITIKPEYKGIQFELKKPSDSFVSERIKQIHDKLVDKGSVTQLSQLPLTGNKVNDMYLVTGLNEYYVWQYNPDTYALNWVYYTRNLQMTVEEGDDSKLKISSELHPVINSKRLDETLAAPEGGRTWKIPVTKQAGILEGFPISLNEEWGFQFLIFIGLRTDSNEETYPLALTEVYDYIGIEDIEHDMDARGIYENHWKTWMEWLAYNAKPIIFYARLTPGQLRALHIHKPQRLPDGTTVMIKSLSINIMIDSLSIAEIEAYTI